MLKRIVFLTISFFTVYTVQAAKPERVIFLWDLHHVILKPHGRLKALKQFPHKKEALRMAKLRNKFLKYAFLSRFREVSSEKILELGQRYDNPYFIDMIITAAAAQKPMEETVAIIKELAENPLYTHHVGSNIGRTVFQTLSDPKQYPQYEEIFMHFDLPRSHVSDSTIRKPDPRFFKEYLDKNKIDLEKTRVIFIDDKRRNIRAAKQIGLEAIRFKNAKQLRQDLSKMGIRINP